MTHSYAEIGPRPAIEWIQAHRGPEMVNSDVGLSGPQPQPAAPFPTQSETRVEFKGTIDKCDSAGAGGSALGVAPTAEGDRGRDN
jgi:hypothetical protein